MLKSVQIRKLRWSKLLVVAGLVATAIAAASAQVPSPQSILGFHPTDDKTIADWKQITDYFAKLDKASPKVLVKEIGRSTMGKPLIVAFISSADNIKNLSRYQAYSAALANPSGLAAHTDPEALIRDGKAIVSISCSIHSTEIVASQMSMNLAYELATATDPGTKEILDNTILLLIPSPNPDGVQIVADWYRKTLGTRYEGTSPPELYHYYAGHDDNRDWFMMNLKETQAITKFFWKEWYPQIVYDVHQQGSNASRFIIPPFFDPTNPNIPPLILREVGLIGYKMAADLQAAGVSGVATDSTYDTWWHGGFRSAPYFHNAIGILSEAASANLMSPITVTVDDLKRNRGVRGLASPLVTATNYPEAWPGGMWHPSDINKIEMIASRGLLEMAAKFRSKYLRNFYELNRKASIPGSDPRQPLAYVIPAGQPHAESVSRMLEILMWQGIEVHELKRELIATIDGHDGSHEIPLGSFLVLLDQPQRNNVEALLGKQVYPDRRNANGEAEVPYDVAGWTLPLQMGVESVAVRKFEGDRNDPKVFAKLENIDQARAVLNLPPAKEPFAKIANPLKTNPRVGLYKGYTGSMDEGWTRFVLDTFSVPFKSVSDADVRSGNLPFDSIILPADSENSIVKGLSADRYPVEFAGGIGDAGVENLKKWVENGGRLICFDDGCEMVIKHFGLPIRNVLDGLKRNEFYNPGSVVKLDVNTQDPLAKGFGDETPAYFTTSSAFEIAQDARVRVVAKYTSKDALLSGWMLGEKYLNGKAALAVASYGKGSVVLFAFRPQHRGQSWATFPFIFNALEK